MIAALTHVFPGANHVLDEHATEEGKAPLDELQSTTTAPAVWRFRNIDIGSYVDMSADELWDPSEVRHIFDATELGKSMPDRAVLVVQAVHHKLISTVLRSLREGIDSSNAVGRMVVGVLAAWPNLNLAGKGVRRHVRRDGHTVSASADRRRSTSSRPSWHARCTAAGSRSAW
jgi:hypothetical protein